ncbi:hypothetical protein [Alteromonas sp. W364]|uniref:hypothetical protein n=1 Tax=Alteromonas sp. W364 TaxID=3075610 RepID=UPI00288748F7|nr:hypothetical protein [Alteromonas sp. W364]MDT0627620.1 hypothetical protein [Alteromonas sp. W364]
MNRIFQLGTISLSLTLGFFANLHLQDHSHQANLKATSTVSAVTSLRAIESTNLSNDIEELTDKEQSKSVHEGLVTENRLITDTQQKQQLDNAYQQQVTRLRIELITLNSEYTNLNNRYRAAKARLDALKEATSYIDPRLIGTSFESLQDHLSAQEWLDYKVFNEMDDSDSSSYELQTLLSDYFILHVNGDVTRLHSSDCKQFVCVLHLYSNDFSESSHLLESINGVTKDYQLELRSFKSFFIEEGAFQNEDFEYAILVKIIARKK